MTQRNRPKQRVGRAEPAQAIGNDYATVERSWSDHAKRKEIPVGIFNAKKTNNPRRTESQDSDCGGYFDDTNYKLRGKERARFKEMLEDLLSAVPDTLTVDDVAELTGYHRRTILRYVQRKYIYAVNIMGKYYISKKSLISYLATDKAFRNTQKSEWHIEIVHSFVEKECTITIISHT